MPRVVVFGGLNLDFIFRAPRLPRPGETVVGDGFQTSRGGKAGNQAVAAARLLDEPGAVAMVGRVGDDWMGRELLAGLDGAGVDRSAVARDPRASSGVAAIYLDASGENTVTAVYGANTRVDDGDAARAAALLGPGGILLCQLETPWPPTARLIAAAHEAGARVVLDPAPAVDLPPDAFRDADILTPNQGEAARWSGRAVHDPASAVEAGHALAQQSGGTVIVTLGADGVVIVGPDGGDHQPAFPVDTVSTLAAGDAFNGALAAGLAERLPLADAVRRAQAAAALSTTRHGAQESMASRAELETFLATRAIGADGSRDSEDTPSP